jgi:hypothetical protein
MRSRTAAHAGHLDAARELIDGSQWVVLTRLPRSALPQIWTAPSLGVRGVPRFSIQEDRVAECRHAPVGVTHFDADEL